ncbi:MAG: hypothetical protein HUN04_22490 [Desulfobacter sp.]|nr:MAG: hypothetical protein HUN04_22490 [Desulfobacter sp.]
MKSIILIFLFLVIATIVFLNLKGRKKEVWETTPGGPYTVIISEDGLACEHPKRKRESIRWNQITEIRLVTTDEGPLQPDEWYLFLGGEIGCSIPSEAKGFDQLWDVFKTRFPDINYEEIIKASTDNAEITLWKK